MQVASFSLLLFFALPPKRFQTENCIRTCLAPFWDKYIYDHFMHWFDWTGTCTLTKVRLVKAMVFPLVMYGCESWTIKKDERRRIEMWCWRRLFRVPWTARRSNLSFLKEISPEYPSEGLILRLKLQYFGHLMWRTNSLEKTLMLGKIEGGRRRRW